MNHLEEFRDGVNRDVYDLSELREVAESIIDRICAAGYEVDVFPSAGQTEITAIKTEKL